MWSTDIEVFHLTKREKRESNFVCGFKRDDLEIVVLKVKGFNYDYRVNFNSTNKFRTTCYADNIYEVITRVSDRLKIIFGKNYVEGKSDGIDDVLLSGLINKDIIMAFNK